MVTGQGCQASEYAPAGWNECVGQAEEPYPCRCLCADGVCPWEQDALVFEACETEQPCPPAQEQDLGDPAGDDVRCVLEAMRDREPGYHQLRVTSVAFLREYRVYASAEGGVQLLWQSWSDVCDSFFQGAWGETEACSLRSPAFFDDCLSSPSPPSECYLPEEWVIGCETAEPVCP